MLLDHTLMSESIHSGMILPCDKHIEITRKLHYHPHIKIPSRLKE